MSGLVEEVMVKEGQHVDKGTPLFVIDRRALTSQLGNANARLEAAKAREQRQAAAVTGSNQMEQGVRLRQRHVAGEHHHNAVVRQGRHGLLDRMARPQLRLLAHAL